MIKNVRLLIVDDIEANLISLEYLLKEYFKDVEVIKANSGEIALKEALHGDIDIIILDIQMPEMDGFEVAKLLKMNKKTKDIPIIFLTAAFREEEFQRRGFEIGAVDYLTKPINNYHLINKLKLYVEVIRKNKELESLNEQLYKLLNENKKQRDLLKSILNNEKNLILVNDFDNILMANRPLLDFCNVKSSEEFKEH